ncbi:MAG: phosphoribosyltransferase [Oscillochloris sp.]|nr:phosphoribosyltransferase [Oscillochloris sp.]
MGLRYQDRKQAGAVLAQQLQKYAGRANVLVLALPRGGVPVAYSIAQALNAPLDLCLVRKLGVPGQEELALGAVAVGGARVFNEDVIAALDLDDRKIEAVTTEAEHELQRRLRAYRGDRPQPNLSDRVIILVDDGLATGATMRAAVEALRSQNPAWLCVAVPVGSPEAVAALHSRVDDLVCPLVPQDLMAVGRWYDDFTQTTDEEVRALLAG